MAIPDGCTKGHVDWHYPKGDLLLEVKLPNADSLLCVEESWATELGGLIEVTGGVNKPMAMPIKDRGDRGWGIKLGTYLSQLDRGDRGWGIKLGTHLSQLDRGDRGWEIKLRAYIEKE
ncbi:hypothetical protein PoB_001996900 [Plakobranchus ocellatus]|uniref:Uncharacterized protein n=1 Tax=Plakobranchus ocellatus TaxID=259542 RepID=A0AAV3ZDJ9_9GAST|nr:hypothetical protein PoB_001996900 [Plakobranchus ocellatus]